MKKLVWTQSKERERRGGGRRVLSVIFQSRDVPTVLYLKIGTKPVVF